MFVKKAAILLNLKLFLWSSKGTGAPEKIKNPQKIASKVDFSEPHLLLVPSNLLQVFPPKKLKNVVCFSLFKSEKNERATTKGQDRFRIFTLFHTFQNFQNFSSRTFPFKTKGFSSMRT